MVLRREMLGFSSTVGLSADGNLNNIVQTQWSTLELSSAHALWSQYFKTVSALQLTAPITAEKESSFCTKGPMALSRGTLQLQARRRQALASCERTPLSFACSSAAEALLGPRLPRSSAGLGTYSGSALLPAPGATV